VDEKTSVLVCLGSAVAANCVACFQHYHREAVRIGLDPSEIEAAVALGAKVKTGANIAVMHAVAQAAKSGGGQPASGTEAALPSCCSGRG
jgi:alkylhydroperoxidase/carboxymuconolactone decarboxylase family protein YurZ